MRNNALTNVINERLYDINGQLMKFCSNLSIGLPDLGENEQAEMKQVLLVCLNLERHVNCLILTIQVEFEICR